LAQLAQRTNNIDFTFFTDPTHSTFRLTHGAHGTMYWGSHNSNTQIRIYHWDENSNDIHWDDVNHAAYNAPGKGNHTAICSDGINFLANDDDRILAAWVAKGVIGFMWDAAQGGGFARPYVMVARFNQNDRSLAGQGQITNQNIAFSYPSVHPNDRGDLGGTIAFGCGGNSGSPGLSAWIADDFNNGTITPLETLTVAVGNRAEVRWGDYFAARVHSPFGNTWVGTGFVLNNPPPPADPTKPAPPAASGPRDHRLVWFGREQDTPPPLSIIYVDRNNTSGVEDGTALHPYSTVAKGISAAAPGDTIIIRSGNYNAKVTFGNANKALTVKSENGAAIIGRP